MRLDKFIARSAFLSRKAARDALRDGRVAVGGTVCRRADADVSETSDAVTLDGARLLFRGPVYLMMNKPAGVLSATEDAHGATVLDLVDEKYRARDLFPVGRLDRDTVGLLLLTDDGALAHELLSPKKHVFKTYRVKLRDPVLPEDVRRVETGVDIGEGTVTLPARFAPDEDRRGGFLTIREGKFHQIKRMFAAIGNEVVFLERTAFGGVALDESLARGAYRELTPEEIDKLKSR